MTKNIIFCADGTWNGPGHGDSDDKTASFTNVFKTFLNLEGSDSVGTARLENELERALEDGTGEVVQIAKYLNGVGDSDNFLVRVLGGTLGAGLVARVVRGYTFVSRNYAPGDKIFLIGFSRGAYTARALAGLITARGLLDARKLNLNDKDNAYRLGSAVWYDYRRKALEADRSDWVANLQEVIIDLPHFVSMTPKDVPLISSEVEAVAVWDTVGALGIPAYNLQTDIRLDAFQFCDTRLSPKVRHGLHAVSIDEMRKDFLPTLWDADPARIVQTLFAGAHSDVGGGYPTETNECGLSDDALDWMTSSLKDLRVRYDPSPTVITHPDPAGVGHRPWAHFPWTALPQQSRAFPGPPILSIRRTVIDRLGSQSVIADLGAPPGRYAPSNLADYIVAGHPGSGVTLA